MRVETIACDLGKPAPRGKIPGRIDELGLDVEILVNNAGFATGGAFYEADPERELEQVRVLVEAVVYLTRMFSPGMVERGRGAILNVASTAGMQPMPYSAGYSAAKAYVLTFSEALHQEMRGHGVTVTALAPGPVETDFWQIAGWETGERQVVRAGGARHADLARARRPRRRRGPRATASASSCRGCRCASACSPAATSRTRSSCRRSSGSCARSDKAQPTPSVRLGIRATAYSRRQPG